MLSLSSHRRWLVAGFCLVALVFAVQSTWFLQNLGGFSSQQTPLDAEPCKQTAPPWISPSSYLNFPHPTTRAKDNLRNDSYYVTAFAIAGFTNEFIGAMQLIYLGILTQRIPILAPIIPAAHVSEHAGNLDFGDVFNLTTLRDTLRHPILEWRDVKTMSPNVSIMDNTDREDPALESLGCWSNQKRSFDEPNGSTESENVLKLDLSYTRVPAFAFLNPQDEGEMFVSLSALAAAIQPGHPHPGAKNLPLLAESRFGAKMEPDEQLACFDLMFYASTGVREFEFEDRWSPVWNRVGTHLRFNEGLIDLTKEYMRRAFGLAEGGDVPPMITVHIRRGDFENHCKAGETPPCFIANSRFKKAVEDMQARLLETRGINASHVLVASDEDDPAFWDEITSFGWSYFDHTAERTHERFSEWHPILIDKVAQSMSIGFVGSLSSTFSLLSARRVEDWNAGETVMLSYYE
ncbi:hypothetical protein EST38_g4627 [Candolleomyces aberdarensis]|uniref:Uncharacterized protein n=1 Tax=Candolleomyces aberdarensis TaxID=2316362 RepID=A0A4Q2DQH8_9AGAR|nr:hypothetical protein EST38_g4627 [Candolleomyces aberdarensis]